jgi:site-specific recombinase XerD
VTRRHFRVPACERLGRRTGTAPSVEEIIAVMRRAPDDRHGARLRALIVVLWRAGLRVQEALALGERDLDPRRGSLLVRQGKGGRRREVGMDAWGWEQLSPWLGDRVELPVGPLFCIIDGPTRGRSWSSSGVRVEFRRLAVQAGLRRRFAPHQLRHAHAVELAREGVALNVIQRQPGHANLGTTSIYLQGERCWPSVWHSRRSSLRATDTRGEEPEDPEEARDRAGAGHVERLWYLPSPDAALWAREGPPRRPKEVGR